MESEENEKWRKKKGIKSNEKIKEKKERKMKKK